MKKEKDIKSVMERIREEEKKLKDEKAAKAAQRAEKEAEELSKDEVIIVEEDPDDETINDDFHIREKLSVVNWSPFIKVIAVFLIVAGLVLLVALNTSSRRYSRNYAKAEKLYSEGKYEEAERKYEKALKIDKTSVDCLLGILCSKEAIGADDTVDTYKSTLDSFLNFGEDVKASAINQITEYILHESMVYSNNEEARIDALEEGYEITDGSEDIKRILKERVEEGIEEERMNGEFDEAIELVNRFADKDIIDSENIKAELMSEKEVYELKVKVLSEAYEALKDFKALAVDGETDPFDFDFSRIMALDGSLDADALAAASTDNSYIYIPSENYNEGAGEGAGLYTFGEYYFDGKALVLPYLFYVGEYSDGKRNGYGISFMKNGEGSYTLYAGEWVNDYPEGKGARYMKYSDAEKGYTRLYEGFWKNGLADGEINLVVKLEAVENTKFCGTFTATAGMGDAVPTESDEYVVQNLRSERLIAVLASDTEGYAYSISCWQKESVAIDALGINRAIVTE
ncbi:MAG: hypothetical protein MJ107_03015 [Lachnospiraceae bacterium]|nr:hypothetical protein [Lachnospiraceae bacterium]